MTAEEKKVLIVDDESDVREFIQLVLEADGVSFVEAADGEEAVEKAVSERPDLVVLDVQMPKKDGFEVFSELRRNAATSFIPIIMLTAVGERTGIRSSARDMGEYLGSEPEAYIEKPIEPDKLKETAYRLMGMAPS